MDPSTSMGVPVPGRVAHTILALYPLAVRRVRDFVIGFLQIPPRDGHPCLDGWFRSLRSIEDLSIADSPPECTSLLDTPGETACPTRNQTEPRP